MKRNEVAQKIIDHYQMGNITFLEAIRTIFDRIEQGTISNDDAEKAIRRISKIKLPQ